MRRCLLPLFAILAASCYEPFATAGNPAPAAITELPRDLTGAERSLIAADNRFAFKIFREIAARESPDSNVFVSPLSMAMALGMTYNGAAGATAEGMAAALELQDLTLDDVNRSYRDLIALLRGLDPGVTFGIANSIWFDDDYPVLPGFIETNRTFFDAEVRSLEFADPSTAPTINGWVNDKTHGRISDIVPDPVDTDLIMYLINAIYFKGAWTQQFDKSLTRAAPFHLRGGGTATVQMMAHAEKTHARVASGGGVTVLDLPYAGRAYSMTIVLPSGPAEIDSLVAGLTEERWNAWVAALDSAALEVRMPKFRQAYKPEELKTMLKALGMTPAFCEEVVGMDFSGIGGTPGDLCISSVDHKAFVDVNEEGTEAAAATAVGVALVCVCEPPPFVVDRPFVFAIRENLSGTILFLGRIVHPKTN